MTLKFWTALWIASLSFIQFASAEDRAAYQIALQGNDLAELNRVKNCIDYTVCEYATTQFSRNSILSRMNIWVSLTDSELKQVNRSCLLPNTYQMMIQLRRISTPEQVLPVLADFIPAQDPGKVSPVILKTLNPALNELTMSFLGSLVKQKRYDDALAFAAKNYEVDFSGYSLSYTPAKSMDEYAVTEHTKKTIEVGKSFFTDPCSVMIAVRHEAEHVFQMNRSNFCKSIGKTSAFKDHLYRERSAYLNDILNIRQYCNDPKVLSTEVDFRYKYLFDNYGDKAALN